MSIDKFITVTEVDEGPAFADGLFQRAYKKPAPDFPHHIVAFYRRADGAQVPVSYVHFTDCGDMFLAGGAATDGNILRSMSADEQAALNEYGGLMLAFLGGIRWGVALNAVDERRRARELIGGAVPVMMGLAAFFLAPPIGLSLIIIALFIQALADVLSAERGVLPGWFGRLRALLTALAVIPVLLVLTRVILVG